jgi:hypothetical protein
MYTKTRATTKAEMAQFHDLLDRAVWEDTFTEDRHWSKSAVVEPLVGFSNYLNAFFIKLPARIGHLHRHHDRDLQRPVPYESYNVVVQSNPLAISGWYHGDESVLLCSTVLQEGHVYLTDRDIMHESWNRGDADRIHLLVEMPK